MDAFNRVTKATLGNVATINSFDGNHLLSRLQADGVQDLAYTFDATTGNLLNRSNQTKSLTETFGYDTQNLDRLSSVTGPSAQTIAYTGNHNGNIQSKSDAGTFTYYSSKPYAVEEISNAQNISPVPQQVNYTSFEKINDISQGTKSAWFTYNADQQRVKMVLKDNGQTTKTHYYFNNCCEREVVGGVTTQYIWIGGDAYSAVAVAKKEGSGSWTVYNIFRDHLGTIAHLKNTTTGVVNNYSFDAWGRRRDADNWTYTLTNEPALFADRGFTGHEYLADFDLYNMNGRLYDPVVGRFLSPDPYIQDPGFTQNLNRYSYVLNNPLKFTDPTGDKWKWQWLNPFFHFQNFMQWVNDKTPKLRQKMANAGIPDFSVGGSINGNGNVYFSGNYAGQEVFNTQKIDRSNAVQVVNREIAQVNYVDGAAWHAAGGGLRNIKTGRGVSNNGEKGNSRGDIISFANGTVALGPMGATTDMGAVFDGYGQAQMYFTIGWAYGFGATAGVGYSTTNKGFIVSDYAGEASGVMLTLPLGFGVEGFGDYYEGVTEIFNIGTNTKGGGGNVGVGAGWFGVQTFTILFNPPPPDFWLIPRSRR